MAKEQRNMSGAIFRNTRKEKPNHPDRTGNCTIDGREYWISGWVKEHDNVGQYLSLEFKPKDAKPEAAPASAQRPASSRPGGPMDFDDDIPF